MTHFPRTLQTWTQWERKTCKRLRVRVWISYLNCWSWWDDIVRWMGWVWRPVRGDWPWDGVLTRVLVGLVDDTLRSNREGSVYWQHRRRKGWDRGTGAGILRHMTRTKERSKRTYQDRMLDIQLRIEDMCVVVVSQTSCNDRNHPIHERERDLTDVQSNSERCIPDWTCHIFVLSRLWLVTHNSDSSVSQTDPHLQDLLEMGLPPPLSFQRHLLERHLLQPQNFWKSWSTLHVTTASPIRGCTFGCCGNTNNMSVLLRPCHKVLQNYVHTVHNRGILHVLVCWPPVVVLEPWVE
jgi:hypothetical protein